MMDEKENKTRTTSFLRVMGDNPQNRVIDFLIENDRESWSMNELSENAGVGYSTLKLLLPKLVTNRLIKVTKEIGKIKLYKLVDDSLVVKKIYELYNEVNKSEIKNLN